MVDSLALLLATLAADRVLVVDLATFDRLLYLSAAVVELFLCANLKDLHTTVVFLVGIDIGSAYDRTHYTEESKQFLALSQLDLALRNIDAQKEIDFVSVNLDARRSHLVLARQHSLHDQAIAAAVTTELHLEGNTCQRKEATRLLLALSIRVFLEAKIRERLLLIRYRKIALVASQRTFPHSLFSILLIVLSHNLRQVGEHIHNAWHTVLEKLAHQAIGSILSCCLSTFCTDKLYCFFTCLIQIRNGVVKHEQMTCGCISRVTCNISNSV